MRREPLPQGYKHWPALRRKEKCEHITGSLDTGFHSCGKLAIVLAAVSDGDALHGFIALCVPCYEKVYKNVVTKAQYYGTT